MKTKMLTLLYLSLLLTRCEEKLSSETQRIVDKINETVHDLDVRRRISIKEDDFIHQDTTFKIRSYSVDGRVKKIVSVIYTEHFERDDYFYFDIHGKLMFSGHLMNEKDDHNAAEFKYYYHNDKIVAALEWEDHYQPHKPFPHEHFRVFHPNLDSLQREDQRRLHYFIEKLDTEGFFIKVEKPNTQI